MNSIVVLKQMLQKHGENNVQHSLHTINLVAN